MNQKIETTKIQVNNGQELISKFKEYKNLGGEWKLLERYWTLPTREKEKGWSRKNNLEGFIISNGEQKVDIFLEGHRKVLDLLTDDWDQMVAIFPEISRTCGSDSVPFGIPGKEVKKGEEKVFLGRMLVAWSVNDIFKIIADYCKENQVEINKSVASLGYETSLKYWVKFGNDADGNIFIWLGKRDEEMIDTDGGGELQISINRKDLENYDTSSYDGRGSTVPWKNLTNQQLTDELLEMRIEPFWNLINSRGGKNGAISNYDNYQVGFSATPGDNLDLPNNKNYAPKKNNNQSLNPSNKNNQLKDNKKSQLLQYFLQNGITKITLEDGKLIIEYNSDREKKTLEVNNQELQQIQQFIQNHNQQSLSLSELQSNNNSRTPSKNNNSLYLGLTIGGVILVALVSILVIRKKSSRK